MGRRRKVLRVKNAPQIFLPLASHAACNQNLDTASVFSLFTHRPLVGDDDTHQIFCLICNCGLTFFLNIHRDGVTHTPVRKRLLLLLLLFNTNITAAMKMENRLWIIMWRKRDSDSSSSSFASFFLRTTCVATRKMQTRVLRSWKSRHEKITKGYTRLSLMKGESEYWVLHGVPFYLHDVHQDTSDCKECIWIPRSSHEREPQPLLPRHRINKEKRRGDPETCS